MPEVKVEVADNLSDEDKAWLEEEDQKLADTEKKIASGEIPQSAVAGWTSENWQQKASMPPPDDIE
jgi:hypothetical protein